MKGTHWRKPQPWWEKAWLEREYATRSAADIAREYGVHENAILYWLKKHGIPRRTVSEARALKWWGSLGVDNPMSGMTGEKNPNWKGGRAEALTALYECPKWKAFRKAIIRQAGGKCVRCPSRKNLHVHCTKPKGGAEAHWDEDALAVLCKECHDWVHSRENVAGEYLEGGEEHDR